MAKTKPVRMTAAQRQAYTNHVVQARRYMEGGRYPQAHEALMPLVQIVPEDAEVLHLLARCELALNRPDLALPRLVRLTDLVSKPPYSLHEDLARAYRSLGRFEDAVRSLDRAHKAAPDQPGPVCRKAMTLEAMGRYDEAAACVRPLLESGAEHPLLALALGLLGEASPDMDAALRLLKKYAADGSLSDGERLEMQSALGFVHRLRGEHAEAWQAMERANLLAGGELNTEAHERQAAALMRAWDEETTAKTLERSADRPDDGAGIVLIVGQPGSGENLVEHILAQHPKVHAGGSRGELLDAISRIRSRDAKSAVSPTGAIVMTKESLAGTAAQAVEAYKKLRKHGQTLVTDSQISHTGSLGTLRAILPGLKVVRVVREPADAAAEAFLMPPGTRPGYSGNLRAAGVVARCERKVMDHWKMVLPGENGGIHEVVYEDLVASPESTVRALLEALSLPFDEACLNPEAYEGPPIPSGRGRVRKPIAEHEIGSAKPYEAHLGPFIEAFEAKGFEIAPPQEGSEMPAPKLHDRDD